jgi:hypothetical protein
MSTEPNKPSSAPRVRAYRERMRALGLKPKVLWVPDVTSPEFAAEASRASRIVAAIDRQDGSDQDFIDAMTADLWAAEPE